MIIYPRHKIEIYAINTIEIFIKYLKQFYLRHKVMELNLLKTLHLMIIDEKYVPATQITILKQLAHFILKERQFHQTKFYQMISSLSSVKET